MNVGKPRVIIVGATSGIGRELAKVLAANGYTIGATGRRGELLASLQAELPEGCYSAVTDLRDVAETLGQLRELVAEMGGLDLLVISSGVGELNPALTWELERDTIDVNVSGFAAVAGFGMEIFTSQGHGHLVAISSIAALRGSGAAPAYNASKAFVSNYLQGLQQRAKQARGAITVTDVKPGFVDTAMAKGEGLFWVASPEKAAQQIYGAVTKKRKHVYVTRRWRLIAWILKVLPG